MKNVYLFLAVALIVLFSINQSQATLSQLGHQSYGSISERIAVKVSTNFDTVFVSTGSNVKVFQVSHSSPGATPTSLASMDFPTPPNTMINAIAVVDSTVLVAYSNGLQVRDYKNNLIYTAAALTGTNITDVVINSNPAKDTLAYVSYSGGFKIISFAHPNNVAILNTQSIPGFTINALAYRSWTTTVDTLFLAGNGPQGVRKFKIFNNIFPQPNGSSTESYSSHFTDIVASNGGPLTDSIYVAEQDSGYRAFRADSIGITSVGKLQSIPNTKTTYLSFAGYQDTLLITSSTDGFRIFRIGWIGGVNNNAQLTSFPIIISSSPPNESVKGFGNLLYFAFGADGLQTYDISNASNPVVQGSGYPTAFPVHDVDANEKYAFIAAKTGGVHIIDLASHTDISGSPFSWSAGESYKYVRFAGAHLYAFYDTGFDIVNLTNPLSPVLVNSVTPGISGLNDVEVFKKFGTTDSTFIIIATSTGIKILDVTNPMNVTTVGTPITLPGGCIDIQIVDNRLLYASPGYGNLAIWDIGSPFFWSASISTPQFKDSTAGLPSGKFAAWDTSYVYYLRDDSVLKINVINKNNLTSMGSIYGDPNDYFTGIDLAGNFLHLSTSTMSGYKIKVVDISSTPVVKDSFIVQDYTPRLKISGLSLFTASNTDGWYHLSDPYGAARVTIARVSGMPADTISLPVRVVDNLYPLGALSFEMFLTFDTLYVQYLDFTRGLGLPGGDSLLTTRTHNFASRTDTVKFARAGIDSIKGTGVAGQDTLLKVRFRINSNAPVQPLIQSAIITSSHTLFNESLPVDFKPGRINISPRFGDANQNGSVTAVDASYILQSVIGLVGQPSLILADVSNNGEVRAYDAALVLKRIVNPSFKYPVEMYYGLKQATAPINKDIRVLVTTENGNIESEKTAEVQTNSVIYEISMLNVKEVWSSEMVIDLGKGQKFMGYKLSSLSEGMTIQSRQEGTMLYLGLAGGTPITEDGVLVQIICQITDPEQVKPIDIQQFILNESLIENIEGTLSGVPRTFALEQNYPNPFNPVTEIKYQLPNPGKITLAIYNILGQQVKILVNSTRPAGYYSVKWDGKDATGINVASGVYFYRIQTPGFVKTRKMMFLK